MCASICVMEFVFVCLSMNVHVCMYCMYVCMCVVSEAAGLMSISAAVG